MWPASNHGAGLVPSDPYANGVSFVPLVVTRTLPGEPLPVDQVTWGVPTDGFAASGIGLTDNTGAESAPALGSASAVSAHAQMRREAQLQASTSSPRTRTTDGKIQNRVVGWIDRGGINLDLRGSQGSAFGSGEFGGS